MSSVPTSPNDQELTETGVTRLLTLGLAGPARPVDELIDRLLQNDGHRWLSSALGSWPLAAHGSPRGQLCEGRATVDELRSIKNDSKDLLKRARDREDRLAGLLGYFFSVAAALAHHGELITSRPRAEVDPTLLELAEVTPGAWSKLLSRAAQARSA